LKIKVSDTMENGFPSLLIGLQTEADDEDGYEYITYEAFFKIAQLFGKKEDIKYPPDKGFKGRKLFIKATIDAINNIPFEEILEKYWKSISDKKPKLGKYSVEYHPSSNVFLIEFLKEVL